MHTIQSDMKQISFYTGFLFTAFSSSMVHYASAQDTVKLTGTYSKSHAVCDCNITGYLSYESSDKGRQSIFLCFDEQPGDHYEIQGNETISVGGIVRSVHCGNESSELPFLYVKRSDVKPLKRSVLLTAEQKATPILRSGTVSTSLTEPVFTGLKKRKIRVLKKDIGKKESTINESADIHQPEEGTTSSVTVTHVGITTISRQEAQQALDFHNKARTDLGIPPLKWSEELAVYAQEWANELAKNGCGLEHRPYSGKFKQYYGENIFGGWTSYSGKYTPKDASVSWYEEKPLFENVILDESNWFKAGHYSQMIWKNTTHMGMGVATCPDGTIVIVANYNPPGNYMGEKAY